MAQLDIRFDKGFAPELPPDESGVLVDCSQMYPSESAYRPFRSLVLESSGGALNSPCYGAFVQQDVSDAGRAIFCATASQLYIYNRGGSLMFSNVSGGTSFVGPANPAAYRSPRWRWTMFGNDLIVLNPSDPPQKLTFPYSAAVPLGGNPPRGSLVEAVGNFVFILDSAGDDWNCCGIGNDAAWSPDIATQAASGQLGDTPGPITAAHVLGSSSSNLLIYKQRAVYLGTYLGPPVIWSFQLLDANAGAVCNEAVIPMGGSQVFMGFDNFFSCDGSPPRVLPNPIRKWFFETSFDASNATRVWGVWDKLHNLVIWYYPSVNANPAGSLDRYVCWNPSSDRWMTGVNSNNVQAVVQAPITAAGALSTAATSEFGVALFGAEGNLYSFSGSTFSGYVTSGDFGDPLRYSFLRGIRPTFKVYPAENAAKVTPYFRYNLGDTQYANPEVQLTQYGWFSMRQNARYHAVKIQMNADCELLGMTVDWELLGNR